MKKINPARALIGLGLAMFLSTLNAQTGTWVLVHGEEGSDRGYSIDATSDGGYVIGGRTGSWDAGVNDFYLLKIDSTGSILWSRLYGGEDKDNAYCVRATSDQGFILAGSTLSYGAGQSDVWLVKTDSGGDTLWTRAYGEENDDSALCVIQLSDDGYLVCGTTENLGGSGNDVYVIRTDSQGDSMWSRTCGGGLDDEGAWVCPAADGGFLIAGGTESFGAGEFDVYLIKIDTNGDTLWTRTYGGVTDEMAVSAEQTSDGGYIVAGFTWSFGNGWSDVYLLKLDSEGDTLWTRTFGGDIQEEGLSVSQTSDGGYIITGFTYSLGHRNDEDIILIKTDSSGETQWIRTFGGGNVDTGYQVRQTADGGYIISGRTRSYGGGRCDIYVLKTDPDGFVGVAENPLTEPQVVIDPITAVINGPVSISYELTAPCNLKVKVYDPLGRKVSTIISSPQSSGRHRLEWNCRDQAGQKLSGVLFVRFESSYFSKVVRLVVVD